MKDTHLIFFAKRRELVDKFNDLNAKYEQYKLDTVKEFQLKDKLVAKWKRKCGEIVQEVQMAKIILSDHNLGQVACKEFKKTCEDINKDNLLKEGCTIHELLSDYWLK